MYQLIEQLNREGITIIMISHDLDAALRYASHILHIGSDWFFGMKADYLRSAASAQLSASGEGSG